MNKPERKRKSSTSSKKLTSKRKSLTDSIKQDQTSVPEEPSHEGSILVPAEPEKPKINYQDELVLIFFNSMLDNIIEEWITIPDEVPLICVCKDEQAEEVITKDFKSLVPDDLQSMEISDIQGSALSLTKRRKHKRRSTTSSRNQKQSKEQGKSSIQKRRSKSSEKFGSQNIDQRSKISLKRSSKSSTSKTETRKSRTSTRSDISMFQPSNHFLDWLLNPPDENVVIKFKNGNRYEGPVTKKLMHGYGKFIWADGTVYEGDFVHGDATGRGTLEYPDLTYYYGNFCKSFLHGEGVLSISSSTMIYSGNWKGGEKHGQGWLLYEPRNWYQGEWYEDKRQGVGLRHYKSGEKFKGKWFQGQRHGHGTFIWANNDHYKGEWFKGIMHGYGEFTWNAFLNETFTFPLENTYQGTWIDGTRDGVGIMNFGTEGGAKLAGVWERNKKHGAGVMVCGNGTIIERNPLFWCDKPIHLETEVDPGYPVTSPHDLNVSQRTISIQYPSGTNKSTLQLIAEQVYTKKRSKKLDSGILQNIAKSQESTKNLANVIKKRPDFPTAKIECSPLHIPVHLAPEQIDFSYYTNLAVQKYTAQLYKAECTNKDKEVDNVNICGGIKANEGIPSTISKYSKWNMLTQSVDLSKSPNTSQNSPENISQSFSETESKLIAFQQIQAEIEEKHLRNTITVHLPKLLKYYDKYATISSPHVLNFKPILIRFLLWQMLRDMRILGTKYTLLDVNNILIENPGSGLEFEHYPFEKIYFWQFLQILITLTWLLHSPNDISEECKRFGILSAIFTNFLMETIYKNVATISACCLFEYRHLLPVNSVYLLYRSLGEPHTARNFLCSVCIKKHENPPCYLKIFQDEKIPQLIRGVNAVPVGGNLVFLPDDPPDIGQKPEESDPEPVNDPFRKELFALRSLGPKKVVQCLTNICPQIASQGVLVNMEYPLTFIEFYETLLMCAFMMVDKVKKREERVRMREERKRLNELMGIQQSKSSLASKFTKGAKDKKKVKPK